jgi:HSP20 family protein
VKTAKETPLTWIAVEKVHGPDSGSTSADTEALTEQIRRLAFHLFESRGETDGGELDDWLRAKQELILTPEAEMLERDGKFDIRVSAAGFSARDIHVTALPASLVVRAVSKNKVEEGSGNVHFSEIQRKPLWRTFDFPGPIDVDRTTASLENGIVHVTAARRSRGREPAAV